jgi:hypothetical protein
MGNATKKQISYQRIPAFFAHHWPIIVIVFLWLVFCLPFFAKGLVPFPSKYLVTFFPPWNSQYFGPVKNGAMPDVVTQIYPWKYFSIENWKNGTIPLWNPYSFSGTVHAGNYQTAVFSPLNLLFFILPFDLAWSILILLQPLLAGIFMYLLLKTYDRKPWATLIGSVSFMFSGFLVVWMAYGTLGYAALFLPLLIAVIERDLKNHFWMSGPLIAFGTSMTFLSGHFQISIYVALATCLYLVSKIKFNPKAVCILFGYFILGIGISMPQFLLTFDSYTQSVRSNNFVRGEVIPWQYLITIFAPDFYGNPVTRNDWFGHYAEWASYIGVIPLIFAIKSLFGNKWDQKFYFLMLGILSVCLAYPTILVDILYNSRIPVLSTSAASRIIFLFSFSLAVMAAYGFDNQIEDWHNRKFKSFISSISVIGLFVILAWVTVAFIKPFTPENILIAKRNLILPSILLFGSIVVIALGYINNFSIRKLLIFCLIVICCYDLLRFATKWMPFDEPVLVYPTNKSINFLTENAGNSRIYGNLGGEVCVRFKLLCIEGYDAMYQGRYGRFVNAFSDGKLNDGARSVVLLDKNGKFSDKIIQLLGVKYIVHRISDGRNIWAYPYWKYDPKVMKSVYKDEYYEIFEYSDAFPRSFLASSYLVANSETEIINYMTSADSNLKESLILEQKPKIEPEIGNGTTKILAYDSNQVIIKSESKVPKLLFLSDVYQNGWKVTVDGKAEQILRADYDFRAISLPSGTHIVKYIYWPDSIKSGLLICYISVAILILLTCVRIKYENRIL